MRWARGWLIAQTINVALMWIGAAAGGLANGIIAIPVLGIVGAVVTWRDRRRLRAGRPRPGPQVIPSAEEVGAE